MTMAISTVMENLAMAGLWDHWQVEEDHSALKITRSVCPE
jgi:hypothetical protein